ncbi:hypothetical protein TWF506_005094 [Arthrobotrys conoides]|uniref:Uncharacterized protein n=1 Tax=Arthrobotrys conoides TaxID=74498 RepID=A0AAN8NNK0_9PEZI
MNNSISNKHGLFDPRKDLVVPLMNWAEKSQNSERYRPFPKCQPRAKNLDHLSRTRHQWSERAVPRLLPEHKICRYCTPSWFATQMDCPTCYQNIRMGSTSPSGFDSVPLNQAGIFDESQRSNDSEVGGGEAEGEGGDREGVERGEEGQEDEVDEETEEYEERDEDEEEEMVGFMVLGPEEFDLENDENEPDNEEEDSDVGSSSSGISGSRGGGIGPSTPCPSNEERRHHVQVDIDGHQVDENGEYIDEDLWAQSTGWGNYYIKY